MGKQIKKIIALTSLIFLPMLTFSQETWIHKAGLSLTSPFYSVNVKDDGIKNSFTPQVTARYFGIAPCGLSFSGALGIGPSFSRDFSFASEDVNSSGLSLLFSTGLGYSFKINKRWTLTALGTLSLDWMRYKFKKELEAKTSTRTYTSQWNQTDNILALGIGGEFLGFFSLNERFSIFACLGCKFFDAGKLWRESEKYNHNDNFSYEVRGNFAITPSIGASIKF
ncbi:MAG: hypothetical protein K5873_01160 [Treponema sp.]|nr:hypothetical protein [Treponema sp.]